MTKKAKKKAPAGRTAAGRFAPGYSGNPSGGKKKTEEMREVEELALSHSKSAILRLVDIAQNSSDEGAAIRAATAILDRGLGKAKQSIEMNASVKKSETVEELSDEELMLIAGGGNPDDD